MYNKWDSLLSEFRRLGGIAENVCQKEGEFGRGVFSINPSLRSRIYTPAEVMVKEDDIYLEGNKLRIKKDKGYNNEIRHFFNFYQDNFSWGGGGKEITESFENGLSIFPSDLKKLINQYTLVDIEERHKGNWDDVIMRQFLNARVVKFRNDRVIAPVWELVNHKVMSLPFITTKDGISTPNYPPISGEITFSYNNRGPLSRFFSHGFLSKESIVYSLPFLIKLQDSDIQIYCKGRCLNDDSIKIKRCANIISIDGLPIADVNHPRLPNYYFDELIRKIGKVNNSKDSLSEILALNFSYRKKIMPESQSIENKVSTMLAKVIKYEINLIAADD